MLKRQFFHCSSPWLRTCFRLYLQPDANISMHQSYCMYLIQLLLLPCLFLGKVCRFKLAYHGNPPAPKVLGRDLPDGTRKRLQVYLGGGIFRPKPPVFDRSWRSPSKKTVKNSTEDTCSWTRPSKIGKRKVKKIRVFQLFDFNFLVCNIFFCGSAGGLARRRIFEFLDPFSDWFSSFCDSRNTGFYSVFLFSACLTASFKTSKNFVNYAVLCYGVNENIVNTSVFWRWLKKHCKLQCFWPPDPQKPWYLQWFLLLTAQKHCK